MDKSATKAFFILLLLGFTWGSGYNLAKYAMTHGVHPLGYSFWQALGPAVILGIYTAVKGEWKYINSHQILFFVITGFLGIALPNTNMYQVASILPASLLAVIVNIVPLIVYPLALMRKLEKFDGLRLISIMLGFIGIILIISPEPIYLSRAFIQTLITPIAFAMTSIYIAENTPPKTSIALSAFGMLFMATCLLLPFILAHDAFYPITWPFSMPAKVIILEIILSSFGYLLFFKLIYLAGPVFYSLTGAAVALTGLFWGIVGFHEKLNCFDLFGTIAIISALLLLSWRQHRA